MKTDDRGMARGAARALAAAVWLAGATIPAVVNASNLVFMQDAPITHFKGTDLNMFQANLDDALEKGAEGDIRRWENPETGSSGEVEIVKALTHEGKRCQRVRMTNRARGAAGGKTDWVFCKQADGKWKVLPPSKQPAAGTGK